MMLSKPVYESLPVSYIIIGTSAMLTVPSSIAFGSGLVLSALGLMILFKRREYRNAYKDELADMPITLSLGI